jgi:hypothetical protein
LGQAVSDLAAFVRARLDDNDRRAAAVIADAQTIRRCSNDANAERYEAEARWVLRDIAAKRAILDAYEDARDAPRGWAMRDLAHTSAMGRLTALGKAVQALAAIESGHPDFDPAWTVG